MASRSEVMFSTGVALPSAADRALIDMMGEPRIEAGNPGTQESRRKFLSRLKRDEQQDLRNFLRSL